MSLLYKENPDLFLEIQEDIFGEVSLVFTSDCGKHGAIEGIDAYKLTPSRLLQILQDRDDYTDEELDL